MRINVVDTRQLAVVIVLPATDKFYNFGTQGWEQPFNPAAHMLPLVPIEPGPSPFVTVQSAEAGPDLTRSDAVAIICTTTGTGATLALGAIVDVLGSFPLELATRKGWSS